MGIRPAKTIRVAQGQQWARISNRRPRKSFVKGAPRPKVRQYEMGTDKYYEMQVDMVSDQDIHLRDVALESARQAANKHLEKTLLVENYFIKLLKYPHLVIREHSALGVAGADRISKGMKRAFGRPKGRMLRINKGETLFRVQCSPSALPVVKKAFARAGLKLSGTYSYVVSDITKDAANLAKFGKAARTVKVREVAKAVEAAPGAAAPGAAPAAGAAPVAGAAAPAGKEAGKDAKPAK